MIRSIDDASGNVDLGKFYGFDFNANLLNQAYLAIHIPATATHGA